MDTHLDSLIALLFASTAIAVMIVVMYRNGALPLRGAVIIGALLLFISTFLGMTLF